MTTWWNNNYYFRRNLKVEPTSAGPILPGHPITVEFNRAQFWAMNKLRLDSNDIEFVFSPNSATPSTSTPVPFKQVTANNDPMAKFVFNAVDKISTVNFDYYMYFNNPSMTGQPTKAAFVESDYTIQLTPTTYNNALTFSRPTEDWEAGFSDKINARAALSFVGPHAKILVRKGPDRGILEVKLDNSAPVYVDTYSHTPKTEAVYVTSGLNQESHYMRLRVVGDKSPSSSHYGVEIHSFQFSNYVTADLLAEEVKTTSPPIRIIVGP